MRPSKTSPVGIGALLLLLFTQSAAAAIAVLGIDLGQEFIKAALVKPGIPLEIVLTKDARRKEAAVIGFKPSTQKSSSEFNYPERLYGADALALAARFPSDTYPNLKQLLGKFITDETVTEYSKRYPALEIIPSEFRSTVSFKSKSSPIRMYEEGQWTVEELLGMQLASVKRNAEALAGSGTVIKSTVIAIPAYFTAEEKAAVNFAAELAGLKVMAFVSDGLAVAMNFATLRDFPPAEGSKVHVIYDMGAGSTTATIVRIGGKEVKTGPGKFNKNVTDVDVLGFGFDRTLGGDAFTDKLVEHLLDEVSEAKGKQIAEDAESAKKVLKANGKSRSKLWKEAGRVRHVLSANTEALSSIESVFGEIDFRSNKIQRSTFEGYLGEFKERVVQPIYDALANAGLQLQDVDSFIIAGGATRTPYVYKLLEDLAGAERISKNVNADEAAVMGVTFYGAGISKAFKVREIRTNDINTYEVAMKYKTENGKDHTQTLFPVGSKVGVEKQVPFSRATDFSALFVQKIPTSKTAGIEYPIFQLTTKNLTSSVTQLKEKNGCKDEEIHTKFAVEISELYGNPHIRRAWTECEIEVEVKEEKKKKDGMVDGVKKALGLNKEKSESSSESASSETSSSAAAAGTETPIKKVKKMEQVTIDLDIQKAGTPKLPDEFVTYYKEKIAGFNKHDAEKTAREEARNTLESFIYKAQSNIGDDDFIAASTDAERAALEAALSAAGEWLYDDGELAALDVVKAKLADLRKLENPISKRQKEHATRPALVTAIREALTSGKGMIKVFEEQLNKPAPAETEEKKDAKDVPLPAFAKDEVEKLVSLYESTEKWLEEQVKKQELLKPFEDPVLWVKDIQKKTQELNDGVMALLQKQMARAQEEEKKKKAAEREKKRQEMKEKREKEKKEKEAKKKEKEEKEASGEAPKEEKKTEEKKHDEL